MISKTRSPSQGEPIRQLDTKKQESLFRSLNKKLRKNGILSDGQILEYGSYVIIDTRPIWKDDDNKDTGYCVGAHKGSRGPALLVAFDDPATQELMSACTFVEARFGYVVGSYKKWKGKKVYVHLVDWQDICKVEKKVDDFYTMLTDDNPAIRLLGKQRFEDRA